MSTDYSDRPSMKMDDHPEHNMPAPEHDGVQMAGDVIQFPLSKQDVMPNTTQVKNDMARRSGTAGGSNVVRPIFK